MIEATTVCFNHSVSALGEGEWAAAYKSFREIERPLCEAEQLSRRGDASLATHLKLSELRDAVLQHTCIAESRQAITCGDRLVSRSLAHSEALDVEGLWTALDKYQEAGLLTRARDVETEAIALARRGRVFAKVLRNESLARPLLKKATELAASLAPRCFHGVGWYDECVRQLQKYQQAAAEADERSSERQRQEQLRSEAPAREKLKSELDGIERRAQAGTVYAFLEYIYEEYPPKAEAFVKDAAGIKKRVKEANADTINKRLREALLHYHTDKNGGFGVEWKIRCDEISKQLNLKYDRLKGS